MIGSRRLMDTYDIQLPSMEYERRHTVNQRRVIYLAVSGKLFSMFQVAYQSDPDTAAVLDSLRRAGLSLIVDCDDFNCDEALLQTAYNLPVGTVKVLSGKEHKALERCGLAAGKRRQHAAPGQLCQLCRRPGSCCGCGRGGTPFFDGAVGLGAHQLHSCHDHGASRRPGRAAASGTGLVSGRLGGSGHDIPPDPEILRDI